MTATLNGRRFIFFVRYLEDKPGGSTIATFRRAVAFVERGASVTILHTSPFAQSDTWKKIPGAWDERIEMLHIADWALTHDDATFAAHGERDSREPVENMTWQFEFKVGAASHMEAWGKPIPGAPLGSVKDFIHFTATGDRFHVGRFPNAIIHSWLDDLLAAETQDVWLVNDDSILAETIATYRPADRVDVRVRKAHQIHASHIRKGKAGEPDPLKRLSEGPRIALARHEEFDALIFLTDDQRAHAAKTLEMAEIPDHWRVVGNFVPKIDAKPAPSSRRRRKGVLLSRISETKRVHLSARAVHLASLTLKPSRRASLLIAGRTEDPASEKALRREIAEQPLRAKRWADRLGGVRRLVALASGITRSRLTVLEHVYDSGERWAAGGFMPVASAREGLPLVTLEAMSVGCIPVLLDYNFGAHETVSGGGKHKPVSPEAGLHVYPGGIVIDSPIKDVLYTRSQADRQRQDADEKVLAAQLARAIRYYLALPESQVSQMRTAAIETVAEFSPDALCDRWAGVLV